LHVKSFGTDCSLFISVPSSVTQQQGWPPGVSVGVGVVPYPQTLSGAGQYKLFNPLSLHSLPCGQLAHSPQLFTLPYSNIPAVPEHAQHTCDGVGVGDGVSM
jgi:hypothetical protein